MAKLIPFREGKGDLNSRQIFLNSLETSPVGPNGQPVGMGIDELDRRVRVLNELKDADREQNVVLEDADWETLKTTFRNLRWLHLPAETMEWLLEVKADLFDAKAPA